MAYYSKLSPSDAGSIGSQPNFGEEVGIGNGKVAVGAPLADEGSTLNRGAVYVYDLDGTNEVKITPTAYPNVAIQFGQNVSIGSNKILVGSGADVCFLYDLDGTNEVVIDPGYSNSNFGFDKQGIKIYKDKIYISDSNLASDARIQVGAVYIYRLSDQQLLKVVRPSDTALDPTSMDSQFGYSIDVEDNLLVVGAPNTGKSGSTGKVYVYDLDGNNERIFEASDGVPGDYLGWKVGIDRGRIIASARLWHPSRDGVTSGRGAAYSWKYDGSDERMFRQRKVYGNELSGDAFSEDSLVAGGGRVYIGARYFENGGRQGSVFSYTGRGLGEYNFLSSDPSASAGDHFSYSMDYDDENGYLVVGAVFFGTPVVGAAYVYQVAAPSGKVRNLSGASIAGSNITGIVTSAVYNPGGWYEFTGPTGSSTKIAFDSSSVDLSSSFSIDMWIRQNGQLTYHMLLGAQGYGAAGNGIGHYLFVDAIRTWVQEGSNTAVNLWDSTGTTTLSQNVWHNLVLLRESGTAWRWYLDGSLVNSNTTDHLTTDFTTPNTYIGAHYNTNVYNFDGDIGALRMYSRALTAAEVSRNFNATRGKYGV